MFLNFEINFGSTVHWVITCVSYNGHIIKNLCKGR